MTLPDGVRRVAFDGSEGLATRGPPVGDEATVPDDAGGDPWRRWDPRRSKVAATLDREMDTGLRGGDRVLYLGAAAGTTASHVADVAGPTYAVEFAPRPMRDLLGVAVDRGNLFPLLADARRPATYAHVVEPVDVIVQDVATRGQATVALANRQFLADGGRLLLAVKARSEDVTREPATVYEDALAALAEGYDVLERRELGPTHEDHLAVVARPR
jgi:fibrillarin-like pre-rRNA processing protein